MYTKQDQEIIKQRLKKYAIITAIILVVLVAADVIFMKQRMELAAMVDGGVMFFAMCFMFSMYLIPNLRYLRFLKDMQEGLSREVAGSIVEVSEKEEMQDGVRVFPVRVFLDEEQDERIVYLNVSKAERFPSAGSKVRLNCFGRHIKEIA